MKTQIMFVDRIRYEIKWYRNAIGEPVISYVLRSKDQKIFKYTDPGYEEIIREAKRRLGI